MQLEIFEAALFGTEPEFFDRALAWLQRDIPFDGLLWAAGAPGSWDDVRVHGRPPAMASEYSTIAAVDPVAACAVAAPERVHVLAAAALCPPHSPAFRFWQGYDGRHAMAFAKPDGSGQAAAWLGLLRAHGEPFSAREQQAMGHAAQAVLTAQQVRRAKAARALATLEAPAAPTEPLTGRELAVAHAYADGRPVKEVARLMGVSTSTVQCHLARIYRKLGVHSKIALRKALQDRRSRPRF
ncbi:helix-turn-helix transcriptional regulator [Pseudoduganella chitinolytica]|uniref:Helix-turn-helix transcriptional regulator n=1 Tax=Pseudoduganella chitinolytica TaxID=34070 RepID=A0ABY8BBI1_9BURK|nr:helix-turn-helix transcriptional regulator [Pseudoduganella chitinolytica]WEF33271.1 helix-turn-helix transcriptional regulator [Pseudoduganella chitinolytica]